MTGCRVEATAWPTIPISRSLRVKALRGDLRRRLTGGVGVTVDMEGSHDYSLQPCRDVVWGEGRHHAGSESISQTAQTGRSCAAYERESSSVLEGIAVGRVTGMQQLHLLPQLL